MSKEATVSDPAAASSITGSDVSRQFYPSPLLGWYAVTVLCVALLLSFTDRLIINLVVDLIKADLGISDTQISLLQGFGFAIVYAVCGLPSGRLADATNRRNLIILGVVIWSAATIACGLATDFWSFFGARVFVGLGEAVLVPAASSLIVDYFPPQRRGVALGFFSIGGILGSGVAIAVGGFLLVAVQGGLIAHVPYLGALDAWRSVMVIAGLPGLLMVPLLVFVKEPPRHHSLGLLPLRAVYRELMANNGAILRIAAVVGVVAAGDYGLMSWFPALLQRDYGFSASAVGAILGLSVSLSGVLACVSSGFFSDFFVRRRGFASRVQLMLPCYLICLSATLVFVFGDSGQMLALALGIWVFGSVSGYVIGHIVMQELVPNQMRATTIAVSGMCSALIGLGLGPTLVALTARYIYGSEAALAPAMTTVGIVAAMIALAMIWRPVRHSLASAVNGSGS